MRSPHEEELRPTRRTSWRDADHELGAALLDIGRLMSNLFDFDLQDKAGLSYRQHRVLLHVSTGEESNVSLSKRFGISAAALSETIHGLVRRGLVSRQPGTEDRRRNVLALTEQGEEVLDNSLRLHRELVHEVLDAFGDTKAWVANTDALLQVREDLLGRLLARRRSTDGSPDQTQP